MFSQNMSLLFHEVNKARDLRMIFYSYRLMALSLDQSKQRWTETLPKKEGIFFLHKLIVILESKNSLVHHVNHLEYSDHLHYSNYPSLNIHQLFQYTILLVLH